MKEFAEIRMSDKDYPNRLLNIPDPPETLYCIGDISLLKSKKSLAVVGSRKCSEYGRQVAQKTGMTAAQNKVTVISGMANGIDTSAHLGTLKENGKTVAVLGTGVDVVYPRSNEMLYDEISKKGLIVSEYPPGTRGTVFTFPQRNRIISGLSDGVAVIEAGPNSGALITAELADRQGRTVFAVPGNITSPYSLGTNRLIMDGACPIAVIDDIFTELGFELRLTEDEKEELGDDEKVIFELLKQSGELTVDIICDRTGFEAFKVTGLLTVMEMKGLIANSLGRIFIAKF